MIILQLFMNLQIGNLQLQTMTSITSLHRRNALRQELSQLNEVVLKARQAKPRIQQIKQQMRQLDQDQNRQQLEISNASFIKPRMGQSQQAEKPQFRRQCDIHRYQLKYVCLTCQRTICQRCVKLYCLNHDISQQDKALYSLRKLFIDQNVLPYIDKIQRKISQSRKRQEHLQQELAKMRNQMFKDIQNIEKKLQEKKEQIHNCLNQCVLNFEHESCDYEEAMKERIQWLKTYISQKQTNKLQTIQEIKALGKLIKVRNLEDSELQKKAIETYMAKDKIIWSERNMEKILLSIQNIQYKIGQNKKTNQLQNSKKRISKVKSQKNLRCYVSKRN